jgi:deoxyribodipyrimidine photo-lyase
VSRLPTPEPGDTTDWVDRHLHGLFAEARARRSPAFTGTQAAADAALAAFDATGYARDRNEVWPAARRGASRLSPHIRHGLLPLPRVWAAVGDAPARDRDKFRDELLWQEYSRHLYARLGGALAAPLRYRPPDGAVPGGAVPGDGPTAEPTEDPWSGDLRCVTTVVDELESTGWLVNQTRMWLASHWSVRHGADWRTGEDRFFTHLLDGSRAANRAGWQWTIGTATGQPYGFSRWQVEKRAPGLCEGCIHRTRCPIEHQPGRPDPTAVDRVDPRLRGVDRGELDVIAGPTVTVTAPGRAPEAVWLTAESLGDDDPALRAHPDLPVVFVFDEPLLRRLRLSSMRLVFLADRLAELATSRRVEIHRGDPTTALEGRALGTVFTPVPGGRRRRAALDVVELHPWPWLRRPGTGRVTSFSAWRQASTA